MVPSDGAFSNSPAPEPVQGSATFRSPGDTAPAATATATIPGQSPGESTAWFPSPAGTFVNTDNQPALPNISGDIPLAGAGAGAGDTPKGWGASVAVGVGVLGLGWAWWRAVRRKPGRR